MVPEQPSVLDSTVVSVSPVMAGVVFNYHRVVSVTTITNQQSIIEVASYVSKEKRDEEAACLEALRNGDNEAECNVYIETTLFAVPYDPDLTVIGAYELLKSTGTLGEGADETQNAFDGADDVFEDEGGESE